MKRRRHVLSLLLRQALVSTMCVVVALPVSLTSTARAADYFWDANGIAGDNSALSGAGLGGTATWDTTSSAWWTPTNPSIDFPWINGRNTAVFWGTAGTVSLGTNISTGGLKFNTTGYTIATGAGTLTLANIGGMPNMITMGSVAGATITGAVGGSGDVVLTGGVGGGAALSTLTLNGTSASGWTGTTTINNGMTLSLAASNRALLNTSGITLNGGALTLVNTTAAEGAFDRVNNSAAITVNGGTFNYTNTTGFAYAETLGAVSLNSGQFNVALTNNMLTGSQTLTLGGLTRFGTATATFSALTTGPNATTNQIFVTGATQTAAGAILGPWATVGTAAGAQTDYAVYDSSGRVLAANISPTADDSTWATSYLATSNVNLSGAATLSGSRVLNTLRYSGAAGTLDLGTNNLSTFGVLNGGAGLLTIAGTGSITTPTGGDNTLYLQASAGGISIGAPIQDNGSPVTLVVAGSVALPIAATFPLAGGPGAVTLSTANTFTGGIIINNGGALTITDESQLGAAGKGITFAGSGTLGIGTPTLTTITITNRPITINNGAIATINTNLVGAGANLATTWTGKVTGSGGLIYSSTTSDTIFFNSMQNDFQGSLTVNSFSNATSVGMIFASLADSPTANGSIRFTPNTAGGWGYLGLSNAVGTQSLTINNRVLELNGITGTGGGGLSNLNTDPTVTLTVNTDLLISSTGAKTFFLLGANTGKNTYGGKLADSAGSALSVSKSQAGNWILSGDNIFTGTTTVIAGTISIKSLNSVVGGTASSGLGAPTTVANGTITLGSTSQNAALAYYGSGETTDRVINVAGTSGGATIDQSGTGLLKFTSALTATGGSLTRTLTLQGSNTGNGEVAGAIVNGTGTGTTNVLKTGGNTWTLSGVNTYTGTTTVNGGTLVLNASATGSSTASIPSGNALTLGGGTFVFKGNDTGTAQTLGAVTSAAGVSQIQVVGGAGGTTLNLGAITNTLNNGALNISVSGTNPVVTSTSTVTNGLITTTATGRGGAITFTSGGTTSFATIDTGVITGLTIATPLPTSTGSATTNYILTGTQTQSATTSANALQIANTSAGTLTLSGSTQLILTMGGLLYTGTAPYTIAAGGSLRSNTVTASDLMIHNFGTGGLTIATTLITATGATTVTLDGPGTTTLSGSNTYTGGTVAGGGTTLNITSNFALGAQANAGPLTLNNATLQITGTAVSVALNNGGIGTNDRPVTLGPGGGTFDVTGDNFLTVSGIISGTGNLTKTSAGTLVLVGANTYSGLQTNIQNGTLVNARPAGALPFTTMLTLGSASNSALMQLGDGTNSVTQTISGLSTSGSGTSNAIVGFSPGNSTVNYAGSVLLPSTYSGVLGGVGSFQNNLALGVISGTLTLTGTNTYSGGTTLSGGTLNVNGANVLGTGTLTITGGTLDNTTAASLTLAANPVMLSGASGFRFGGTMNLDLGAGAVSATNPSTFITLGGSGSTLTMGAVTNTSGGTQTLMVNGVGNTLSLGGYTISNDTVARALIITGTANVVITGAVGDGASAPPGTLTYSGTGTLRLAAANTYSGATVVSSGTVIFNSAAAIGGSGASVTVGNGAIVAPSYPLDQAFLSRLAPASSGTVGLFTDDANNLDLSAGGANLASVSLGAINTATYSGLLTPNSSVYRFGGGTATLTIANILADSGGTTSLLKTGVDTLALSGANTFTGVTTIAGGTLQLNSADALKFSAVNVGAAGAIAFQSGIGTFNVAALGGAGNFSLLNISNVGVTLVAGSNNASTIFNGALSGAGGTFVKVGTGTLTLGGANTFGGGFTIKAGTVIATNSASALGAASVTLGEPGNNPATLLIATSGLTYTNPIVLATGATGLLTIGNTGTAVSTTFSGGVTGTNDFTINSNATTGTITFSTAPLNNSGAINLVGPGTGTTTITGGIGPNVTLISLASDTGSPFTISTTSLTVNPSVGTTVINASGKLFTLSSGTIGTGDLTITNNASAGGVTITTTAVNNAGQITLNGNSSVATAFSAPVGPAVTAINVNTPNSVVTISGAIDVGGGLAINSNTTTLLTVGAGVISGTGDLTLSAAGTGAILLNGTNTFVGNAKILQGTVNINNLAAFGDSANVVTLGAASGTAPATLAAVTTSRTYTYAIVLGGTSGTLTITNGAGISGTSYTGGITGSNNLTLSTANTVGTLTFTTKPIDIVGNLTIDGTAPSGAVTISSGVSSNVKQINLTSTSPALTVGTTALTVNTDGTTLINQGTSLLTVSGGVIGTGNLTLKNNGATTSGITVSGTAVNIVGSIINSGTGSGSVLLSAPLSGGSIPGITQASDTSPFNVSGAITLANTDLTFSSTGAALLNVSSTITGPKNLSFIVNSSGSITASGGITNAGSITVSGTGNGTVTLSGALGASVTGVNQNSATAMLVLTTASLFTTGVNINTTGTVRATAGAALGTTAGQVTFNAAGTLDLRAGTGTYTTGINITNSGGTILVEPTAPGPGVTFSVSGLNTFGTQTLNIAPGVNVTSGSYALNFNSISTLTGSTTFALNPAFPNTLTLSGGFNLGGGTRTLTFNGANSSVVLSGAFSGTAGVLELAGNVPNISVGALTGTTSSLRISGTGTYTFNGASSFSGGVVLNNSAATIIGTVAGGFGLVAGQITFNVPETLNLRAALTTFTTGLNLISSPGIVVVEPAASGPAVTHTLSGANSFASNSLTVVTGGLATSGIGGLTLAGATTLSGPMTFTANQSTGGLSSLLTISGTTTAGGNSITATGSATLGGGVTLGPTNFSTQAAITVKANTTAGAAFALGAVLVGGRTITFNNSSTGGGALTTTTIGVTAGTNPTIIFAGPGPITTGAITLAAGTFGNTITNTNTALTTFTGLLTTSGPTTINTSSAAGLTIGSLTAGVNPLVFTGSGNTTITGALTNTGLFANAGSGNVVVQGQTTPVAGDIYSNTGSGALNFKSLGNILAVNITGTSPISIDALQMLVAGAINYTNPSTLTIGQVTQNLTTATTLTLANNGGTITVDGGIVFAVAGAPVGALAVSGTGTTTIMGPIGGNSVGSNTTGGLTVSTTGTGSLTLGGTNLFTGIVTLSAGSLLKISSNANLGANATATRLTMSGGTLRVTNDMTLAANGAAGVSLSGAFSSMFSVDSGKTLTINQPVSLAAQAIFTTTGAGDTTFGTGGVVNLVGTAGFANFGTGTLTIGSGSGGITGTQNMTFAGTGPIVVNGVVATGTGTIVFNGNGGRNVGAGTVTFGNANTNTGAITINAGTLIGVAQASGSPFGAAPNVTVVGGALQLNPATVSSTTTIGILTSNGNGSVKINAVNGAATKTTLTAASLAKGAGGIMIFDIGTGTYNTEAAVTFTTAPTVATSGIIQPWAVQKVSDTAVDFLTYSTITGSVGLAMYTGHTVLPTAVGSSSTVYMASGITKLTANTTAHALRVDTGSTIQNDTGSSTLTIGGTGASVASILFNGTGSLISTATLALGTLEGSFFTGGSNTISSDMTGSGGFTVYGPGTLTLSGTSSVAGTVTINNATLALNASNNFFNNAITLRGTLRISGDSTFISSGAITAGAGGGSIVVAGGGNEVILGPLNGTVNGPVTLTNNGSGTLSFGGISNFNSGLVTTTAGNIEFNGAYLSAGVASTALVVAGGTTTLNYIGTVIPTMTANVTGGTLLLKTLNTSGSAALSNLNVLGGTAQAGTASSAAGAALVSAVVTINSGTFDLNGFDTTIGRLTGTGGIVTNSGSNAATLTTIVSTVATYAGVIQDGSKSLGITLGSGSVAALTLTGANTYTGTTTINSLGGAGGIIVGNPNALQNTAVINNVVAGATGGLSFTGLASGLLSADVAGLSGPGITVAPATSSFQLNIGGNNASTVYSGTITTGLLNAYVNKVGTGNWYLGGLNTYLGYTNVAAGSLELGINNALPTTTVLNIASNAALEMNDFSQTIAGLYGTGTIRIGKDFAGPALTIGGANTSIFGGVVSGLGSLVKSGAGTTTLTGANTYTGATTISAGTLNLDFSVATPPSSVLASTTAVVLSGGTLRVTAPMSGSATQSLGGVTLSSTTSGQIVLANSTIDAALTVNLGTMTRSAGSMLNISVPTVGTNTINTSSFGNAGLITDATGSAFVTLNNLHWAAKSGDSIVPVTYSPNVFGAGLNTDIITTTPTLGGTTGSLRFNISSTLTLNANSTITSGGILVTAGVSTSATSIVGNGFNLAGPSGGDFVVYAGGTGGVTFSANLVDGPDGITGLTKSGTAFLALSGNSTYSGVTTILSNSLVFGAGGAAPTQYPTGPIINMATLSFNTTSGTVTLNQPISGTGVITNTAGNTVLNGVISTSGTLTNTAGNLTLGGTNSMTGATTLTAGTITLTNPLALQNSTVTPAAGTLLFNGITSATLGGLTATLTPTIALPAGFTLSVGNNNVAGSYTGTLTGSGNFTKIGSGIQTLTGLNTYSGSTTIANGGITLTFPAANTTNLFYNGIAPGALLMGGGTTTNPTNATLTITGTATAGNSSTQNFSGTTLATSTLDTLAITATAGTTVNIGLGSSITRNTGSMLAVTGWGSTTNLNYTGGTANTLVSATTGPYAGTAFVILAPSDFGVSNRTNTAIVPIGMASATDAVYTLTSATPILAASSNARADSATATWNAGVEINSFSQAVVASTITVNGTAANPSKITSGAFLSQTVLTFNGGVIQSQSNEFLFYVGPNNVTIGSVLQNKIGSATPTNLTIRNLTAFNFTLTGANTYTGTTAIISGIATFSTPGPYTLSTSAIINNGFVRFAAATGTQTVNAVISGSGNLQIQGGTVLFNAKNTYAGSSILAASGTIQLGIDNALPTTTAFSFGALTGAGVLDLNGFNQSVATLASTGTQAFIGTITNNSSTANSTLTFGDTTNQAYNAVVADGSSGRLIALVKQGSGTQTFQGINTFTGGTTINAGTIDVVQGAKLSGLGSLTVNAGALTLNTGSVEAFASLSGNSTAGAISLAPATVLSIRQMTDATFAGSIFDSVITNDGFLLLASGSNKTLTLTNSNYYGGPTTINGGILSVAKAASLGDGSATNTISLAGGTLQGTASFSLGATRTIALGAGGGTIDVTGSNVVTANGSISGSTSLTKTNTGTLALASNNTFTGPTIVSGGTLVAGSVTRPQTLYQSSSVSVGNNATLIGTGTTLGTLSVATGGTISPGSNDTAPPTTPDPNYQYGGIGSFTAAAGVTLANQSTFTFQFLGGLTTMDSAAQLANAGTNWDLLQTTTGTIDLGSGVIRLNVVAMSSDAVAGVNPASSGSLTAFDFGGSYHWMIAYASGGGTGKVTYTGDADINNHFSIDASQVYAAYGMTPSFASFYVTTVDNGIYLNYSAVPEPGSLLLSMIVGLAFAWRRWRKNRKPPEELILAGAIPA